MTAVSKDVILTGLRANSEFHLGNYLGAILPMVELQKKHAGKYQLNMFVPDLHSFTTPIDHGKLYQNTLDNLKVFVAAGLDIENPDTFIYRQSFIPAHSELTWILDCFSGFDELSRMTEFKDKSRKLYSENSEYYNQELGGKMWNYDEMKQKQSQVFRRIQANVSAGLFNYPVLMAADILLYGAKWIPVGEDQRQHIELARDLAQRINNKFGGLFMVPEEWKKQLVFSKQTGVRIRSLRNPEKKMSKSIEDPAGTIMLSDKPDKAAQKVMSATTDSVTNINLDFDKQPGLGNLLQISALLADKPLKTVADEWQGKTSYGDLKKRVAQQIEDFLADLQDKLIKVDENVLLQKLEQDEKAMNDVANKKLLEVQKAVGLRK